MGDGEQNAWDPRRVRGPSKLGISISIMQWAESEATLILLSGSHTPAILTQVSDVTHLTGTITYFIIIMKHTCSPVPGTSSYLSTNPAILGRVSDVTQVPGTSSIESINPAKPPPL
jgi:hypothetical protein